MPITLPLTELYAPITTALADARVRVGDAWREVFRLASGESLDPIGASGKLLRPAACLLSAGASGADDLDRFVPLATSMELLHLAALAHDDVIDGAGTRRGVKSLQSLWGNHAAILGGDFLVAHAFGMLASYGSCALVQTTVESLREMAEGELSMAGKEAADLSQRLCIDLARKKTGALFAAACSAPCHLIDSELFGMMWRYGIALGTAFQLVDDLLDLLQDEETLGKPACGDITERKPTLPLLFLREGLDAKGRDRLNKNAGKALSRDDRLWVSEMLEVTNARERTEAIARKLSAEAQASIGELAPSPFKESLLGLAEFILVRES